MFSPIAHFTPIANHGGLPHGWGFYEPFDTAYIRLSKAMLICCLDGWEKSIGVKAEIEIATKLIIPIGVINEPFNRTVIRHIVRAAGLCSIKETRHEGT